MDQLVAAKTASLYASLLGNRWADLHSSVRIAHGERPTRRLSGTFEVRHGTSLMARVLIGLFRLPRAREAVATTLTISPEVDCERWTRRFDAVTLESTQYAGPSGVLVERIHGAEYRFQLEVCDGSLVYRQIGASVRIGRFAIRIPGRMAPRVEARVDAARPDGVAVSVTVTLPGGGLLIAYRGRLEGEKL